LPPFVLRRNKCQSIKDKGQIMNMDDVARRGLVLLGCGKMGSAMLQGWLEGGLPPSSVWVIDPKPSDWVNSTGVTVNGPLPDSPAIALLAVKPQMMGEALPQITAMGGGDTLFLSVAAGTPIATFEAAFGASSPIVRAMPNTPAAVGRGITAIIGNEQASAAHLDLAEALLRAVGQVVRLDHEDQMDAVTGVSGSGPAYVFHMIECLAAAAEAQGLSPELSMQLAKATVAGSGALAEASQDTPSQLRVNVTSPNGTTQAGLEVLMDDSSGLPPLMRATVAAAADRSRELRNGG
jgi:pyrroline-5-carboxylate reductase